MDVTHERKMRGSQIPGFGNWDYVNELPITQYFECARQAGIMRYTSGECNDVYNYNSNYNSKATISGEYFKPRIAPPKQANGGEKRAGCVQAREGSRKQAGKVMDATVKAFPQPNVVKRHLSSGVSAAHKQQQRFRYDNGLGRAPKAVDEDLYKIPPELLKRKRRLGFFSRCLLPSCAV